MALSPKTQSDNDERMSFGDHLEELRRCLIMALVGVLTGLAVMLVFAKDIIAWLHQPLAQAQYQAGLPTQLIHTTPTGGFTIYLKVSILGAIILSAPWIAFQFWRFIAVGLYASERRVVRALIPFSAGMVAIGVLFMYYIMLPVCLWFFTSFSTSFPEVSSEGSWLFPSANSAPETHATENGKDNATSLVVPGLDEDPEQPEEGQIWITSKGNLRLYDGRHVRSIPLMATTLLSPLIDIHYYFNFVAALTLGIVIAFQLPVGMTIVGWAGVVDPALLAKYRRHCVLACFALGMLLTPSDLPSMMLLAFPLWGLFELGLILMRRAYRRSPMSVSDPPV